MSRRTLFHFAAAFSVAAAAVGLAVAVVGAKPAQARPTYTAVCNTCHTGTPSGSVTAVPSTTTPSPGAAYTVAINVDLATSGTTGYKIADSDAAGTTGAWTSAYDGGPNAPAGQTAWTANMTAPSTPGTYYYKVWGVKGYTGSASSALYSITVAAPPAVDTTAPTTTATGAADNGWYKAALSVTLKATDNAGGSGVDSITYTLDGGAPVTVAGATAQVHVSGDGQHVITYQATDLATSPNTEALKTIHVNIDTVKPTAAVLANATVRKGKKATIKYRVTDAAPNGGTAVTTIKIKSRTGKTLTLRSKAVAVGTQQTVKFTCKLRKGVYKITATARDKAGNVSAVSAARKLTVK